MPDRGGLLDAVVVERDGAELGPAEELLARYGRYLLLERELDPTTVVGSWLHSARSSRLTAAEWPHQRRRSGLHRGGAGGSHCADRAA